MRVDERNLSDAVSAGASRTGESQRVQVGSLGSSGPGSSAQGDRVDLSTLTGRISQALGNLANHAAQRVTQLHKDYQAGRYQPDAQQISHAMASEWLGSSRG